MNREYSIKQVQDYYDEFLASEPGKHSPLAEFEARYNPVLAYLRQVSRPDQKILDIGCGTGMATAMLADYGEVYGIDLSPKSIRELKANDRCLDAVVSLGESPPFRNAAFDIVVCTEVIEHLIDPAAAISEMNRILKPGRHLLLSTPNPWYYPGIRGLVGRVLTKMKGKKIGSGQIIENFIALHKLRSMLKQSGFTIKVHYTVYFHNGLIGRILRIVTRNTGLYQVCIATKTEELGD